MKKSIYKALRVPAALLFSFDILSISGDCDTGLNENKTVCEHLKRKISAGREKIGIFSKVNGESPEKSRKYARNDSNHCKIGEMTIKTYKTNGKKGIMTKYATEL